jgi:hypothetical protein
MGNIVCIAEGDFIQFYASIKAVFFTARMRRLGPENFKQGTGEIDKKSKSKKQNDRAKMKITRCIISGRIF